MKRALPWLIAALMLAGCGGGAKAPAADSHEGHDHEEEAHSENEVHLNSEQRELAGIRVEAVSNRLLQLSLEAPGVVESTTKGRVVVTPLVAGRVDKILVTLGQKVSRDQAVAVIQSADLARDWSSVADAKRQRDEAAATVREAKSEVDLALAKLQASQTSLTRQRELAKAGAFSQAPLQQAQSELNDAQSELLSIQKEQASHAEVVRRLENLFREGIVSRAELDAAKLELEQDEIRLDRASARIAAAKTAYERERNIASRDLLNAKEVQTAEAEVRSSRLEVERARIRASSAQSRLQNAQNAVGDAESLYSANAGGSSAGVGWLTLRSPIAGTVTHLDITKGQAVDRVDALMEIEDLQAIWVTAQVPEREAAKIAKGDRVTIVSNALPGQSFSGVVQVVADRIDPKTRSAPMRCLVSGANGRLKPGMFATVSLNHGQSGSALAIPATSLVKEQGKTYAFVETEDGGFELKEVEIGEKNGDLVRVLSGLKAGDRIAVAGVFSLNSELKKDALKGHEH